MEQDLLKTSLNGLERKMVVLLNEHKNLKAEVGALKTANSELKLSLRQREDQLDGFRNQAKITKIVDTIHPDDGNGSELRKTVDDYIREIDKCIAHLSR
jgi:regulator of replication initiation timing